MNSQIIKEISSLENMTSDLPLPEKKDYAERHKRATEIMSSEGIDLMILSGSVNLQYFTGIFVPAHDRFFACVLPKEDRPFILCPSFEVESILEKIIYGHDRILEWREYENPFLILSNEIKSIFSVHSEIAIDSEMPFWYFDRLKNELPHTNFTNADSLCFSMRAVKSEKEQSYHRRAAEISLKTHQTALDMVYEGMSEEELREIYAGIHLQLGAQEPWGGGGFGKASSFIHGTTQTYPLKEGMVILADAGAKVFGYTSDISRTISFGKPNQEIVDAWEIAYECQRAGIAALEAGMTSESVDLAIRKVLSRNSLEPTYQFLPHRAGHGIGLEVHEPPYLVEGNKQIIKPGMIFAFDGAIYYKDKFGIRLEDNFLVTEDGVEIFGNQLATSIDRPFS